MSVAPSFKDFPKLTEPYYKDKKWYIKVQNPKTGTIREVRWYPDPNEERRWKNLKKTLGFDEGYVTIFKGDVDPVDHWFRAEEACRYHKFWGWYVPSTLSVPDPLPYGIQPVQLKWEDVAVVETEQLKNETLVREAVAKLLYEPSVSQWQGQVGEKLERTLTVKKVIPIENNYRNSTMHIFSDPEENIYVWTTAAKTLEVGKTYIIRGTVKEHKSFKNIPQTILIRCAICPGKTV